LNKQPSFIYHDDIFYKESVMRKLTKISSAVAFAVLGLAAVTAHAESTYGYNSAGAGTVTAIARLNISVAVPKLILLRVGSANTTIDTLTWAGTASIPATPTTPANVNNTAVNWDGTAPTIGAGTNPAAVTASAWTNAGTGTINCAMGAWSATGGPTNANFTVASVGTLAHPGANLGACASTAFTSNAVQTSSWTYSLGGTPASWSANTYTNQITYTATGI
jgi:hypothetical protein